MNENLVKSFEAAADLIISDIRSTSHSERITAALKDIFTEIRETIGGPKDMTFKWLTSLLAHDPHGAGPVSPEAAYRSIWAVVNDRTSEVSEASCSHQYDDNFRGTNAIVGQSAQRARKRKAHIKFIESISTIEQLYKNGEQQPGHYFAITQSSGSAFLRSNVGSWLADMTPGNPQQIERQSALFLEAIWHAYRSSVEMHSDEVIAESWHPSIFSLLAESVLAVASKQPVPGAKQKLHNAHQVAKEVLVYMCNYFHTRMTRPRYDIAATHFFLPLVSAYCNDNAFLSCWPMWPTIYSRIQPQPDWIFDPLASDQRFDLIQQLICHNIWLEEWRPLIVSTLRVIMESDPATLPDQPWLKHLPAELVSEILRELLVASDNHSDPTAGPTQFIRLLNYLLVLGAAVDPSLQQRFSKEATLTLQSLAGQPISDAVVELILPTAARDYDQNSDRQIIDLIITNVNTAQLFRSSVWSQTLKVHANPGLRLLSALLFAADGPVPNSCVLGELIGHAVIRASRYSLSLDALRDSVHELQRAIYRHHEGDPALVEGMLYACRGQPLMDKVVALLDYLMESLSKNFDTRLEVNSHNSTMLIILLKGLMDTPCSQQEQQKVLAALPNAIASSMRDQGAEELYELTVALLNSPKELTQAVLNTIANNDSAATLRRDLQIVAHSKDVSFRLLDALSILSTIEHDLDTARFFTHTLIGALVQALSRADFTTIEDLIDLMADKPWFMLGVICEFSKHNLSAAQASFCFKILSSCGMTAADMDTLLDGSPALLLHKINHLEVPQERYIQQFLASTYSAGESGNFAALQDVWREIIEGLSTAAHPEKSMLVGLLLTNPQAHTIFAVRAWEPLKGQDVVNLNLAAQGLLGYGMLLGDSAECTHAKRELVKIIQSTFSDILYGSKETWQAYLTIRDGSALAAVPNSSLLRLTSVPLHLKEADLETVTEIFNRLEQITNSETALQHLYGCETFLLHCLKQSFTTEEPVVPLHTLVELLLLSEDWTEDLSPAFVDGLIQGLVRQIEQLKGSKIAEQCLNLSPTPLWTWCLINYLAANTRCLDHTMVFDTELYPDRREPELFVPGYHLGSGILPTVLEKSARLRVGLLQLPSSSTIWSILNEHCRQLGVSLKAILSAGLDLQVALPDEVEALEAHLKSEEDPAGDTGLPCKLLRCALAILHQGGTEYAKQKSQEWCDLITKIFEQGLYPSACAARSSLHILPALAAQACELDSNDGRKQLLDTITFQTLSCIAPVFRSEVTSMASHISEYNAKMIKALRDALSVTSITTEQLDHIKTVSSWVNKNSISSIRSAVSIASTPEMRQDLCELYEAYNAFASLLEGNCAEVNTVLSVIDASLMSIGTLYYDFIPASIEFFAKTVAEGNGINAAHGRVLLNLFIETILCAPAVVERASSVLPAYNVNIDCLESWNSHIRKPLLDTRIKAILYGDAEVQPQPDEMPALWLLPVRYGTQLLASLCTLLDDTDESLYISGQMLTLIPMLYEGILRASNFDKYLHDKDGILLSDLCNFVEVMAEATEKLCKQLTPIIKTEDFPPEGAHNLKQAVSITANLCVLAAISLYREHRFDTIQTVCNSLKQALLDLEQQPELNIAYILLSSLLLDQHVAQAERYDSIALPLIDQRLLNQTVTDSLFFDLLVKGMTVGAYAGLPSLPGYFVDTILYRWCFNNLQSLQPVQATPFGYPFGTELVTRAYWEIKALAAIRNHVINLTTTSDAGLSIKGVLLLSDWLFSDLLHIQANSQFERWGELLPPDILQMACTLISMRTQGNLKEYHWHGDALFDLSLLRPLLKSIESEHPSHLTCAKSSFIW